MSTVAAISFNDPTGAIEEEILHILNDDQILARTYGQGQWDGIMESVTILLVTFTNTPSLLRAFLGHLASKYGQEAIGFTSADTSTTLVYATKESERA